MNTLRKLFKDLRKIYPGYLVLLFLFPIVVSFIIDSDLADNRFIIINLAWIPLFTIPGLLLRKKIIIQFANIILIVFGFMELVHWIAMKGPITLTSLMVIANTNMEETSDFYDLVGNYKLLLLIPFFIIGYFAIKQIAKTKDFKIQNFSWILVLLFSLIFLGENAINNRFVRKGIPQVSKVGYTFITEMEMYRNAMKDVSPKANDAQTSNPALSETFVLILGESCNRNHLSLYGYDKITTPLLEKRKDLIVFDDVISPYSNTINSVLSMLSEDNLEKEAKITDRIDLLDIFNAAGFSTTWISNQSPIGVWDNMITEFANKSHQTVFVNTSSNSSFESINKSSLDSKVFEPLEKALQEKSKKKFIVVHLMGNHSKYSKRYPKEFEKFTNTSSKKNQTISEYDNSILYTDFVVDSLLNMIASNTTSGNNKISSALFLSDHGENVYDEKGLIGHSFTKIIPKANIEIPFVFWLSNNFKKQRPELFDQISTNKNQPYISDDLFHTLMDLNTIKSKYFKPQRSIINKDYLRTRKRILKDKRDYDLK